MFKLNLQLFATKKAGGSSRNGRDSHSKRLGIKVYDGSIINAGSILFRQRGTKIMAGDNVKVGRDHTLFSLKAGKVSYYSKSGKSFVKVS